MVARTKRENEKCVHVSRCAGDFITAKCSEIEVKKQHAIDTLTDELGKTKELYRSSLAKVNELYGELDAANRAKELADQENEELRGRVKALTEETEQIHILKAKNLSLSETMESMKGKHDSELDEAAVAGFAEGEKIMGQRIEKAWELVYPLRPFAYFERRMNYAEDLLLAETKNEDPPSPFVQSEEEQDGFEEDDDEEDEIKEKEEKKD